MAMAETDQDGWFSEETATFGDRLAGAREAVGLTQEEFARRLGVKLKTVEAWENDLSEPRANRLQMMAGLLNVSIRWLLTGAGVGPEDPDEVEIVQDFNDLLLDLRQVRMQHQRLGETLGKLEKRLRLMRPARDDAP
jgi:transcriptional regulator with XRE-family HTH domain